MKAHTITLSKLIPLLQHIQEVYSDPSEGEPSITVGHLFQASGTSPLTSDPQEYFGGLYITSGVNIPQYILDLVEQEGTPVV